MSSLLITGSARGIGHELAQRALSRGDTVFAAVRKAADAGKFPAAPNLHVVVMDVSDTDSVTAGFAEVDRLLAGRPLDAVINSAAIAPTGALELTPVEDFAHTVNTNLMGSVRVLKAAIPRLRGHGGRLILVTSLWGRASGAMVGVYGATKHAIESLADSARRETGGMNLHIVVIEPGVVKTQMYTNQIADTRKLMAAMSSAESALYGTLYERFCRVVAGADRTACSTEQAAGGIEKALFAHRPKTRYRVGLDSHLVCFLNWLLPDRWMDGLMGMSLNRKALPQTRN